LNIIGSTTKQVFGICHKVTKAQIHSKGKLENYFLGGRIFTEKLQWEEVKKPRQVNLPGLYAFD
jgi:hypothetical protein